MAWSKKYYDDLWTRIYTRGNRFVDNSDKIKSQKEFPDVKSLQIGEGRQIMGAVLFVDIVSFTERSGYESPNDLLLTLDIFLSEMAAIVTDYGGSIEKFTGDGLMAVFDTAGIDEYKMCKNVIDAATTMRYSITSPIKGFLEKRKIDPISYRIGVDGGKIVVGKLGIKSDNDPVAIGWAANIASKLQEIASVNGINLGRFIYHRLPDWEKNYCVEQSIPYNWTYILEGTTLKYPFYSYTGAWKIPPTS